MVDAVQEASSEANLAEAVAAVITLVLRKFGNHAFANGNLNKSFTRDMASAVRDKVEELAMQEPDIEAARASIVKHVLDVVFDAAHDEIKDFKDIFISASACRLVLRLLKEILKGWKDALKKAEVSFS